MNWQNIFFCWLSEGDHYSVRGQGHYLSQQPGVPSSGADIVSEPPWLTACVHMDHKKHQPLAPPLHLLFFSSCERPRAEMSFLEPVTMWWFPNQGRLSSSEQILVFLMWMFWRRQSWRLPEPSRRRDAFSRWNILTLQTLVPKLKHVSRKVIFLCNSWQFALLPVG